MRPVHEFKANFTTPDDVATDATDYLSADGDGQAGSSTEPVAVDHPSTDAVDLVSYEEDSTVRNLCLVWPDGRRAFFNYAYLVAGDLTLQDKTNTLLLSFGAFSVSLHGYNLAPLYTALSEHRPKTITATQPRYSTDAKPQEPVVIEIVVKSE